MPLLKKSFISSEQLNDADIAQIFDRAKSFKAEFTKKRRIDHLVKSEGISQKVIAMVFSEPSTRTRLSFQMASFRLGLRPVILDNLAASSISKGETFEDTLRNIAAMQPDALVVRYGVDHAADKMLTELPFPVINGGIGAMEHPTQALLDALTIEEFRGKVKGEKVLLVGDVLHSRVANSNLVLLSKMGAEIAYCAPEAFSPSDKKWKPVKHFTELNEAMKWATVVMGLRIQKERHSPHQGIGLSIAEYREKYRIGSDQLKHFIDDGILLHPGPVIRGIEFSDHVLSDPRCKVLEQVTNGVFLRAALLSLILGFEVSL
ncbi:MAG: aspartate carbamoyltransferase catalytic subunit [Bdellovibrionales bacterium]|nr:aspartate carbamoyltransferase catalytic subunit [Bdellovibrionales bacterium]